MFRFRALGGEGGISRRRIRTAGILRKSRPPEISMRKIRIDWGNLRFNAEIDDRGYKALRPYRPPASTALLRTSSQGIPRRGLRRRELRAELQIPRTLDGR